jgi:hypothetical protein
MRTLPAAALAAALLAATVPAASADPNYHYQGGCQAFAVHQPSATGASWSGVWTINAVATRAPLPLPAPTASITVRCDLDVNGVRLGFDGLTSSGTGVAVTQSNPRLDFTASVTDDVQLCETVTVETEEHVLCKPLPAEQLPRSAVFDLYDSLRALVDPVLCLLLGVLAPGIGPVTVDPQEGDVALGAGKIYDCAPATGDDEPAVWVRGRL